MNLKPRSNSIFATLSRKPWWISALIAAGIATVAWFALPPVVAPAGVCAALPFAVISGISAWKRRGQPNAAAVENTVAAVSRMSWATFVAVLSAGFSRDGSSVETGTDNGADIVLTRFGRVAVVGARRWKVARTGVEPLKALLAARRARDAHESIYITVGEISDPARVFARDNDIQFMTGAELARLLPELRRPTGQTA